MTLFLNIYRCCDINYHEKIFLASSPRNGAVLSKSKWSEKKKRRKKALENCAEVTLWLQLQ